MLNMAFVGRLNVIFISDKIYYTYIKYVIPSESNAASVYNNCNTRCEIRTKKTPILIQPAHILSMNDCNHHVQLQQVKTPRIRNKNSNTKKTPAQIVFIVPTQFKTIKIFAPLFLLCLFQ